MDLTPQSSAYGFTVVSASNLPEIDGVAYVMKHPTSGAKLLYLKNDDTNKSFAIGFKTPPQDDTGVFHILEHSVLCGSQKFPVKEPFVDLLKGSMQTFLNAMTFSDKTLYPVASTNEQDLFNLMDVYLDAVFHPQIYQKEAIFQQEGWHYEFAPSAEEEGDSTLIYNGVVYNEMKGVFSDPTSVLFQRLQEALFPTTCYAFESGGDPQAIPTLTYEHYLDEHRRHYRTDNSYIILYGDVDIDRALKFLDAEYLTPVSLEQHQYDVMLEENGKDKLLPREITYQEPLIAKYTSYEMNTSPENACSGYAVVVGDFDQHERIIATDILLDALLGSNEAPLKRALLERGVAQDIAINNGDPVLQPFLTLELRMPTPGATKSLPETLQHEVEALLEQGLDKKLIEAALSHAEFIMREHEFGISDGVIYSMQCLNGWLYGGEATEYLRYEEIFSQLRQALETDYFENLLSDLFCSPKHAALVEIIPCPTQEPDAQSVELAAFAQTLSTEQKERIIENVNELRVLQEAPDSPEALATLPHLTVADLDEAPTEPPYNLMEDTPLPCLYHHVTTHGIAYAYRYFPLDCITFEDMPYVTILNLVLGKLDTTDHTAAQIDTLVQAHLGNLTFYTEIFEDRTNPQLVKPYIAVSASALSHNTKYLAQLPQEIMLHTCFNDTGRILNLLKQRKIALEQAFITSGHSCAVSRARSYVVPAGVLAEQLSNVGFYQWLCELIDNFEQRSQALMEKLDELAHAIFRDDQSIMSFGGSTEDFDAYWQAQPECGLKGVLPTQLNIPEPLIHNEAFIIPGDVSYSALAWDRRLLDKAYDGSWLVAARVLSYDYLWNEVRVKGGAYGVGFKAARKGSFSFYSYRDPHIDETLQNFSQAAPWLKAFKPTEEALEGFIVATVATIDAPVKPRALIRRQDSDYFGGYTSADRLGLREEVIHTTTGALHEFSSLVEDIATHNARCTFSAREIVEQSRITWDVINLMN